MNPLLNKVPSDDRSLVLIDYTQRRSRQIASYDILKPLTLYVMNTIALLLSGSPTETTLKIQPKASFVATAFSTYPITLGYVLILTIILMARAHVSDA